MPVMSWWRPTARRVLLRGQEAVGLLHEGLDLGAHGQRAGGGNHAATGTDQDLVARDLADAAQGATRRRCGDVQAGRGSRDASLFQQRVQSREQVQIQLHPGNSRGSKDAGGQLFPAPAEPVTPYAAPASGPAHLATLLRRVAGLGDGGAEAPATQARRSCACTPSTLIGRSFDRTWRSTLTRRSGCGLPDQSGTTGAANEDVDTVQLGMAGSMARRHHRPFGGA